MIFPSESPFGSADRVIARWARLRETAKEKLPDEARDGGLPAITAARDDEALYSDLDRALSLIEADPPTPSEIAEVRNILQRLRDDTYRKLR